MIPKVVSFLDSKKETFNKYTPIFLTVYFILICFPYIFARIPILNSLFTNSTSAFIIRFGLLFVYCVFGFILMLANKKRPNLPSVYFIIILFFTHLITVFISPSDVISYSFYFTSKISLNSVHIGTFTKIIHIARFTGDLIFFFFLFNIYPFCLKKKEHLIYVVIPALIIALLGVGYSIFFEFSKLVRAIQGDASISIISIFHSKNAFGIFLFNGSVAAVFSLFYGKKKIKYVAFFLIPIFMVFSFLIDCKLAAICISLLFLFSYVLTVVKLYRTHFKVSITLILLILSISIFVLLIFVVPQFRMVPFINYLYGKVISSFNNFDIGSFIGRTTEWSMVPLMTKGVYSLIGFSSATGYMVVSSFNGINATTTISDLYDLHNAYVDLYAYHGVIGCCLFAFLYLFIIVKIVRLYKNNHTLSLMLISFLIVSIMFGMAETYRLFVSMSANTFCLSVVILATVQLETKEMPSLLTYFKRRKNDWRNYE